MRVDSQQTFENFKKLKYREIYLHELAHKQAGGALAGSIVIKKDTNGIPYAGFVRITVPPIEPENPRKTISQAGIVLKSALAPATPSLQDKKVAIYAKDIIFKAKEILFKKDNQNKHLNIIA